MLVADKWKWIDSIASLLLVNAKNSDVIEIWK